MRTMRSAAHVAIVWLSGAKATPKTASEWACTVPRCRAVSMSHTVNRPFRLPVASVVPSGLQAPQLIPCWFCSWRKMARWRPLSGFHSSTGAFSRDDTVTSVRPSGDQKKA